MTGILQGLLASIGGGGPGFYGWGRNANGQLGINNTTNKSSPTQIGDLTTWSKVGAGGYQCFAIKSDGSLWSWGANNDGQLGLNDRVYRSQPVQIGTDTDWTSVAASTGNYNSNLCAVAIKTNGTLWAWGGGNFGQLGNGNRIPRSSPVQIGALTTWSKVAAGQTCAAIKTDSSLWVWGANERGALGNGEGLGTNRSSPIQVSGLWSDVSVGVGQYTFVAGIKTAGTLFTWGDNYSGQLGINNGDPRSTPTQLSDSDWAQVAAGGGGVCTAIKTTGSIWMWGKNNVGQLGLNNLVYRSQPVQIGSLTDWKTLARMGGRFHSATIKTNDTLWVWGDTSQGQLGNNSTTPRMSSPIQIGAETWSAVSCGYNSTFGIEK
jgi:alpha-tubulin suppressor-like RCC1 family protein